MRTYDFFLSMILATGCPLKMLVIPALRVVRNFPSKGMKVISFSNISVFLLHQFFYYKLFCNIVVMGANSDPSESE